MSDKTWESDAACRPSWVDREWFFEATPEDFGLSPGEAQAWVYTHNRENDARARLICAECPVARACLLQNLDAEEGIFGGFNQAEREAIREGKAVPVRRPVPALPDERKTALDLFKYGSDEQRTRTEMNLDRRFNLVGMARTQHALVLKVAEKAA